MLDEEQETLAAEYVLGTLSAEERQHAEALLTFDPGFEAAVRQWERRLGELNVMVEAVEPRPEVWDRIKGEVTGAAPPAELVESAEISEIADFSFSRDLDTPAAAAALAAHLGVIEPAAGGPPEHGTEIAEPVSALSSEVVSEPVPPERGAEVIYLDRRVRRWRRATGVFGAIAALLALYVAVWQAAPDYIPSALRPAGNSMVAAQSTESARMQHDRLVAVLQQGPNAPAFLLTVDTQKRTLYVRRVSATPEAGKSYELWLISSPGGSPRSLGVVGGDEFTERLLPSNIDTDAMRAATYAVSLEPAGGSKSARPSGPVLFTGKAVESLPASPPAKPSAPRT